MGLIRNATEQGRQAVENIIKSQKKNHGAEYDLIIVGAGPAGVSAALAAKKYNLRYILLEQDTLGGAVFTYPRTKIVMTAPMDLPLHGKVRFTETSKQVLLGLWKDVIQKFNIPLEENCKVESVMRFNNVFRVTATGNRNFVTASILLAIGRRGSPRKLNVPGEDLEKVAYRLMEPEDINGKNILIVGGGDSAVESALLLADRNNVTVSYRNEVFARIKPLNSQSIDSAVKSGKIRVMFNSNLQKIESEKVHISTENGITELSNDMVFIFAGGELPTQFLERSGISITRKHGETILKH
jgi:thioredoxin reductase